MLKSIVAAHLLLAAPMVMQAEIKQIHLKVGQEHCIELSSCPSAGYEWTCRLGSYTFGELPENRSVVSIGEQTIDRRNQEKEILGATVIYKFVITAVHPGRALVDCTCMRAWENQPIREMSFEFIVE